MSNGRRILLAGLAAIAAPLALAPSALGLGFEEDLSAAPASANAGVHSNVNIHIGFTDADDQVKDLTIGLPPGLIGDPTGPVDENGDPCTVPDLNADACPTETEVGSVTAHVNVHVLDPLLTLPLTVNGSIYNLEPQQGEPARFGIVLRPLSVPPLPPVLPNIVQQAAVKLRPDFGLSTVLTDTPHQSSGLETDITSLDMSLQGTANGESFMRNPTSCGTKTTTFEATSYADPETPVTGQATYGSVNCAALPFTPALAAAIGSPGHVEGPTHPPLTTTVTQPEEQAGVRDVTVLLPPDVGADNLWLVPGPHWCPEEDFEQGTCPAGTVAGSARAESPLLTEPLQGPVVIVDPAPGGAALPRLGLDLQGPLHIQLFGSFALGGPTPGNQFKDIPDIPLSDFRLEFDADKLVLSARDLCTGGAPTFDVTFTGWNGAETGGVVPADVDGCGGNPKASIKLRTPNSKKPKLKVGVKAGSEAVTKLNLRAPKRYRFGDGGVRKLLVDGAVSDEGGIFTSKRRLRASGFEPASDSVGLRLGNGALRRAGGKGKAFRLKVTVEGGETFSFRLKP
jgi:hypothetical protein